MRGRPALPVKRLEQYDFVKLASTVGTPRERRRFLAFAHIQDGKTFSEAARIIKVAPRTVIVWAQKFRKDGIEALKEKPGRGAKRHIPEQAYEALRSEVERLQKNRKGGRIRGQDINDLIAKKYGKRLTQSCLYNTLKRAGLSWITGRSQHPKADEEAQATFKKTSKAMS